MDSTITIICPRQMFRIHYPMYEENSIVHYMVWPGRPKPNKAGPELPIKSLQSWATYTHGRPRGLRDGSTQHTLEIFNSGLQLNELYIIIVIWCNRYTLGSPGKTSLAILGGEKFTRDPRGKVHVILGE